MNTSTSDSRIVVTGMGWITPLGNSIEAAWNAMVAGKSGVSKTTLYDAECFPTSFSAEVKDFDLGDFLVEPAKFRHTSRRTQFLLAAASQAWSQANVNVTQVGQDRIGLYLANGEGVHDFAAYAKCCLKSWDYNNACLDAVRWGEEALGDLDPVVERENDPSSALLNLATLIGARGPCYNTLTACAASLQAIGEAITILRRGEADVMLVGGSNSMIHPLGMTGFNLLGALSTRNDSPMSASRPFDRDRDGFVIGEGAGILVLETMNHAQRRQATILAELSGYGSSADAYRVTDQHPESSGMIRAMQLALDASGVKSEQIDYINAHGTGTRENDRRLVPASRWPVLVSTHTPRFDGLLLERTAIPARIGHQRRLVYDLLHCGTAEGLSAICSACSS